MTKNLVVTYKPSLGKETTNEQPNNTKGLLFNDESLETVKNTITKARKLTAIKKEKRKKESEELLELLIRDDDEATAVAGTILLAKSKRRRGRRVARK
jgi:hypothetical protein